MIGGELLEGLFCLDGLGAGGAGHEVNVSKAREVVDEDGGRLITLCCQFAFELGDKTWLHGDELVHGDNLFWSGCRENLLA